MSKLGRLSFGIVLALILAFGAARVGTLNWHATHNVGALLFHILVLVFGLLMFIGQLMELAWGRE